MLLYATRYLSTKNVVTFITSTIKNLCFVHYNIFNSFIYKKVCIILFKFIFRYNFLNFLKGIVLVLYQPSNGYCYNSDTHFLHNFILQNLKKFKNISGELLDIGSGSGILGLLIARDNSKLNLNQCELQNSFQELSTINAKCNKIETNMYKGSFLECDFQKQFDICVSNPPFYHSNVVKSENQNLKIARYNDFMPLNKFIKKCSEILKNSGKLFFCYDVKQLNEIILTLNQYRLNIEVLQFVHPKKDKEASLVLIYAKKNSKSLLKIIEPLIVFNNTEFTHKVEEIYKKSSTHSIKVEI